MEKRDGAGALGAQSEQYEVGYGKPPKHTQFKKGTKSPNPSGRPKGSKGMKRLYEEAFDKQKIMLNFNGKKRRAGKKEASMHMLAQKASAGDLKAIALMLQLEDRFGTDNEPASVSAEAAAHDLSTLQNLISLHELVKDQGDPGDETGA